MLHLKVFVTLVGLVCSVSVLTTPDFHQVLVKSPAMVSVLTLPDFHQVLVDSPAVANLLYATQIQRESKVEGDIIYQWQTPLAEAESAVAQVLNALMPKSDARFANGISAYWTFQIRIARRNSGSKWHNYAKNLPTGVQTIKRKSPTNWSGNRITGWTGVREFKVIVY